MALPEANKRIVRQAIVDLLTGLGEDPHCEQFAKTPDRVVKLYDQILDGQFAELGPMTSFAEVEYDGVVMVHHVPFYAFCAHHLLLFQGTFAMAYVPSKAKLGLSKLVRIFRHQCKRPTTQEEITEKAINLLMEVAEPSAAMCHVRADHTCMTLRGVKSPGALTTTQAFRGSGVDWTHFLNEASK
jgi:GTP cyclohydrolase I